MKASVKLTKAIAKVEKKFGAMEKRFFVEREESARVGRGFYDGCQLHCRILKKTIIVNHNGEIFY